MASPLLDRRDLTAQRERVGESEASAYGSDELARLCAQMAETNRLLRAGLQQQRSDVVQLCVTDGEVAEAEMENFPAPGSRRLIVRRTGAGGTIALAAGAPVAILVPNDTRIGGQIVNVGANSVTLSLSRDLLIPGGGNPLPVGAPEIGLNGNGGAWDLRLSNLLWCGGVIAVAAAGGSSVTVAEV